MLKLSRRLQALANFVPVGAKVADIGTDHAFLPCYLVKEGIVPFAIGIDVKEGPFQSAGRTVSAYHLKDQISIRLGDGLIPLQPGEVDVVILAGMGGNTMIEILEGSPQVVEGLHDLVLQPMNGAEYMRRWLTANEWIIVAEDLLLEDGHYYQIIKATRGTGQAVDGMELYYGPLLIANRHRLLPELIEKDIQALQDIIEQLAKSQSGEAQCRSRELGQRVKRMKELKECLLGAIG